VKIADGTIIKMADTAANQAKYPQPDDQKPGLGFPTIRLVVLFCLVTGAVLDAAVAAYAGKGTGELSLLRSIWDQLLENEILPADGWADATISCVGTNRRGPTGWIKKPTTRCRTNWNSAAKHRRWRAWNTTNSPIGSASKEHSRHSTPFSPPSCSHPHARTKSTDAS
jgi:hypothetical protein